MIKRFPSLLVAALTLLVLAVNAGAGTRAGVTITASAAPWTVLGSKLGIKGAITPLAPGLSVSLQQKQGGGWMTVQTGKLAAGGKFSFTAQPKDAGTATFRVVTPKGMTYGASPNVVVRVLRWSYLADQYVQSPSGGELFTDPIAVHGITYRHPVSLDAGCYNPWNGDGWINYPLKRQYERFTATVGIGDAADPATTASFAVVVDGKTAAASQLVHGQTVKVDVSLDGAKSLQLRMNVPDPTGAAGCSAFYPQVVFGDAQWLGP